MGRPVGDWELGQERVSTVIRVLYVDDEQDDVDEAVAEIAERNRFEIERIEHAAAAIDILETGRYDCVLSGHDLTQLDGISFLEAVRERWPDLPFVLYTDSGSESVASEAISAGVTDYVEKERVREELSRLTESLFDAVGTTAGDPPERRGGNDERRFDTLFETMAEPVLHVEFVEDDAVVRNVNPAFEETFGFEAETLVGKSAGVLQLPTDDADGPDAVGDVAEVETTVSRVTDDGARRFRLRTISFDAAGNRQAYAVYSPVTDEDAPSLPQTKVDAALERTETGVWTWEPGRDRFRYHDATDRLFGVEATDDESLGEFLSRIDPVERERIETAFEETLDGDGLDVEFQVRTAAGEQRWIRATGDTVRRVVDTDRLVGVFTDVTEQKDREETLEYYETVVEASGDPVYVLDEQGRFEFVDDAFVDAFGYTRSELIGESPSLLLDEADVTAAEQIIRTLLDSDLKRGVHECQVETNYGTSRWCEINVALVPGPEFRGTIGIVRDVTERKENERELAHQRDQFAALFDAIPEPVARIRFEDDTPILRDVNDAFATVFGHDPDEVAGTSLADAIVPDEKRDRARELYDRVADGDAVTSDVRRETTDGSREFLFRSAPIDNESGTVEQFAVYVDITDVTEMQRQLERQRDDLELINQMMRHDIRNDLQVVIGIAEFLADHLDGPQRDHATTILDSAEHAVDLTKTAGDLADTMLRSETAFDPVSLDATLGEAVDEVRSNYDEAEVTVEDSIPDLSVQADEMLTSVFRNLLQNAVRHNDEDVPEVTVSVSETDDHVTVRVADNGPGVPDGRVEQLFEEGEGRRESSGTGIGLYLVATLVDRYDGTVEVTDNNPKGAVFTVELPLA
jgi:PAS domain S-box-containing protein